ncbi:hypothetical protein PoB_004019100 [Plakobranchus ocellatus]|uniref:Uncharacterized protein n=1 Tax=Plakobranchus ocellatus TaxID=259542 RepID=A0AAV4AZI1_9GAST|nr:hypothetical protein PoB_004019100 [Plakobranchus ocellatus]
MFWRFFGLLNVDLDLIILDFPLPDLDLKTASTAARDSTRLSTSCRPQYCSRRSTGNHFFCVGLGDKHVVRWRISQSAADYKAIRRWLKGPKLNALLETLFIQEKS